ncbi:MAG: hypothetical protein ACLS5G_05930 [Streptococcus sp.]
MGNWYYIKDEKALTGMQNIDNVTVYYVADGKQVNGDTRHVNGSTYHFEKDSGQLTRNAFASDKNGNWYYLGHDGKALTGSQVIDNIPLYFYPNGVQAKDAFVVLDGNSYYFQKDSGQMVRDRFGQMTMETGTIAIKKENLSQRTVYRWLRYVFLPRRCSG